MNIQKEIQRSYQEDGPALYRFLFRSLQDEERSKELVQQCYLILLKKNPRLEAQEYKPYLFGIAKNLIYEHWRKQGKTTYQPELECIDPGTENDVTYMVRQALSKIPEELRIILTLKEYHGFDYQELAKILTIPVGTVRSRLFRARKAISDVMQEQHIGETHEK